MYVGKKGVCVADNIQGMPKTMYIGIVANDHIMIKN